MSSDLVLSSRQSIQKGSQSFAAASALFDSQTRIDAEMLYAWCRHCDDVIDGQSLGHDQRSLPQDEARRRLEGLYALTKAALAGQPLSDPAFAAFSSVAIRRRIPQAYALDLIDGFAMDVEARRYETLEDVLVYCWHVAGVVGTMMAIVMGVAPDDLVTLRRAQDLGLAFQLTNIARDIVEDARNSRVYLPAQWLDSRGLSTSDLVDPERLSDVAQLAQRLVEAAEPYYASARWGLLRLPLRSAWAVATARSVYRQIGIEVVKRGASAWDRRTSVSSSHKVWLALGGGLVALRSATVDRMVQLPDRPKLWSRL